MVEDNTVVGNANGITLAPGAERNIFRRNLITGNPPVQVAVDHPANTGYDIRNSSGSDTNQFQGNVCLTSVNAPCPAFAAAFPANPNPVPVIGSTLYGMTTVSWIVPNSDAVEIHIGSPSGPLFAAGGSRGSAPTGVWVSDGMTFYLQDVSLGKPLTAANTVATLTAQLQRR